MEPDPRASAALDLPLAEIRAAAAFLDGRVHRTPMLSSATAGRVVEAALGVRVAGGRIHAKAEHLQLTGSYKVRGATYRISRLSPAERAAGVIAISAGNHAAAVAMASRIVGVRATVVMPAAAVRSKVEASREQGAEVILHGADTAEAWAEMERIRDARGLTFVHPFDHPESLAGQATVGLEIVADLPDVDVVVVPVGGGGLACGVAAAVRQVRPAARVYGVEPEGSDALRAGLAAGHPVPVRPTSIADGLNAPFAGTWTIALGARYLDDIVLLSDPEILSGVRFAAERMKQVVEPAGGAALAAVLHGRVPIRDGERVAVILSGGNVATERFGELLAAAAPIRGL